MNSTELSTMVKDFLDYLIRDPKAAAQFAQDPHGTLAAQGLSDHDLSGVDLGKAIEQACQHAPLPVETRHELHDYATHQASHGGGHQSLEHIIQQIQQVQNIVNHNETYHDETYNSVDNSQNVYGSGNVLQRGDDVTALDHGTAVGHNEGQLNTGAGASQVGGSNTGVVNTGTNTGIQAGHDVGEGTVGNGNTSLHGTFDHSAISTGAGSATSTDLSGADFGKGATVAVGGSAHGGSVTENSGNTTDSGNSYNSGNRYDDHSRTEVHDDHSSHDDHSDHSIHADHSVHHTQSDNESHQDDHSYRQADDHHYQHIGDADSEVFLDHH